MKKMTSNNRFTVHATRYTEHGTRNSEHGTRNTKHETRNTFSVLLFSVLLFTLNAQVDENFILSAEDVQKNELKITPEMEEIVVAKIKNTPEEYQHTYYGIKNIEQLENLHLGKPIPFYDIVNEELQPVYNLNVSCMSEEELLSLRFANMWNLPVMSDGVPLFFGFVGLPAFRKGSYGIEVGIKNTIEHFHNYEYKDSVIGSVCVSPLNKGMDFLIIRKEDKDIFVEVYDKATGEYFKNEYGSGELITLLQDRAAKEKEAKSRYYAQVANKSELILTPEISEMLLPKTQDYWTHIRDDDKYLSLFGIKNGAQIEHLQLGKPVPEYMIANEKLTFRGYWEVPVMSEGEPLFRTSVKLEEDGQYRWTGSGGATMIGAIRNYEHKDLIIGILKIPGSSYLIIRKDNTDIFVKSNNSETDEVFIEYSLSDIINLFKK